MVKLGLIGCGAIGTILAKAIEERLQEKFMLKVIFDISSEKTRALKERLHSSPIAVSYTHLTLPTICSV